MVIYIGIAGKMASGKTTFKRQIQRLFEELSMTVQTIAFADYIKEIAHEAYNMPKDEEHKDRPLLIKIGTAMREINKDVFVNVVRNRVKQSNADVIIIDDCRFKNEYDMLKQNKWILIRINTPEKKRVERIKMKYPKIFQRHIDKINDQSETQIDHEQFHIEIDGTQKIHHINQEFISRLRSLHIE